MFELTVALKYLVPKKKSLSTALISFMSIFVISLIVWLVIVFLSVTSGIEKNWLTKLTTLHAPVRISPNQNYYNSYYYLIDSISHASEYSLKTIKEKAESEKSDPFIKDEDAEIPPFWPKKENIDLIKTAIHELDSLNLTYQDYEVSGALLKIQRGGGHLISQMSYLISKPNKNPNFETLVVEHKSVDGDEMGVLLPQNYKKSGVCLGDTGSLSYSAFNSLSNVEQAIPIVVEGFYDPGLVSVGNKCIIVPQKITQMIHTSTKTFSPDGTPTNGFFVWLDDISEAKKVKQTIVQKFEKAGISNYFEVDTFEDFEFAKDLLNQFRSDKTLFLLIASIILIVACSNIISLLVILVSDKKKEIAIMQSMGASFKSIAAIFGVCGLLMGLVSCMFGSMLAFLTLKNLPLLVGFLSKIQGREAFNPLFFGNSLPSELSREALLFILIATPLLSFLAGLIPAMKASRIKPSTVLRAE